MPLSRDLERELHRAHQPAPAGSLFETFGDKALRRVDEVIGGKDCKWLPSEEQRNLLILLRNHRGRGRAVPLYALIERLGTPERALKELVRDLRLDFGVLVCSARGGDGYWIAATETEVEETLQPYRAQAISELRVVRAMTRTLQTTDEMLHQIRLELEPEAAKEAAHAR